MIPRVLIVVGLPLYLVACSVMPVSSWVPGYVTDTHGNLLKNADGQCWRTAEWRPALAIPACEPALATAAVKPPVAAPEEKPIETTPVDTAAPAPQPGDIQIVKTDAAKHIATVTFVPLTLASDIAFAFNDGSLTPDARQRVAVFATRMRQSGATDLALQVTGYADRIGTRAYNQRLSEQRAAAVKAALIAHGFAASAVTATGVGERYPVTRLEDCADTLSRQDLINCFAPDRRVEIHATGKLPPRH